MSHKELFPLHVMKSLQQKKFRPQSGSFVRPGSWVGFPGRPNGHSCAVSSNRGWIRAVLSSSLPVHRDTYGWEEGNVRVRLLARIVQQIRDSVQREKVGDGKKGP